MLVVTWLGMDIGVFSSSFWIRNQSLSGETRLQIGRLAGLLDMGPRSSLILMLASGLLLTMLGNWGLDGLGQARPYVVAAIAGLCVLWLWAVWQQYFALHDVAAGHDIGRRIFFVRGFRQFDLFVRIALGVLLVGLAVTGLMTGLAWLRWKVALFGLMVLAGVGIRIVADQFPVALGEIARLGSTPEREARLATALLRAYPFVLGLWAAIVVMIVLAVAKPT
ncbi:MAG TPA: hypothetical protein VGL99_03055 [Chloroflexota bacterium]